MHGASGRPVLHPSPSRRSLGGEGKGPAPRLELDWEQGLFTGLRALWKRWKGPEGHAGGVDVSALLPRLILPIQVVAGWPCQVSTARGAGGLQAGALLLPARLEGEFPPEVAMEHLLAFSLLGARMLALGGPPAEPGAGARFLASLRQAALARRLLIGEWPGMAPLLSRAEAHAALVLPSLETSPPECRPWVKARGMALQGGRPWLDEGLQRALEKAGRPAADRSLFCWPEWLDGGAFSKELGIPAEKQAPECSDGSEAEMPMRADVEEVRLSGKDLDDQVLQHIFEKVETADEYRGGTRQTDGEDELEDQLESLQEVDLRHVIRGGQAAHSLLRADLRLDPGIPDAADSIADGGLPYPEWDQRTGRYREDWCRVFPARQASSDAAWAGQRLPALEKQIRHLVHLLERERERPQPKPRQEDGSELDTDAYADDAAALLSGHAPEGRWYVQDRRQRPDLALTLLLDVSLSSDSWVGNHRVLDLCKDAALVLGEVMGRLGERLEILAFSSRTRHHCRVWKVHGREGDWAKGRAHLGALQPEGYTRMGPALRYATDQLAREASRRRLLLLITDGRPTDFDRYEGRHGMSDVRQALREAVQRGVHVHALALDPRARAGLPAMLGDGRWHLLHHPEELPELLTTIYGRLSR